MRVGFRLIPWSLLLALGLWAAQAAHQDVLVWKPAGDTMSAHVSHSKLDKVFKSLRRSTGWEIFVEPGLTGEVNTRFSDIPTREALRRLLPDLNHALVPRTNRAPALYVYKTTLRSATQLVATADTGPDDAGSTNRIGNELIVTLKDGRSIAELAKKVGAKVVGSIDGLNAYRLRFEDDAAAGRGAELLRESDDVARIEENTRIARPTEVEPSPGLGFPPLSIRAGKPGPNGQFVIGLIDSAVQANGTAWKDFILPGVSIAGTATAGQSADSHGTFMAQTILRGLGALAEDKNNSPVRILPIDVYGNAEFTSSFDVAKGVYTAAQGGASVINMSLGSDSENPFLARVLQESSKAGILLVAAAGNDPVVSPTYPAAYPEVLAVTAGDRFGHIAPYANRGEFVDLIAPGTGIVQANGQTFVGVGTSFSSAYVSGAAAAVLGTLKDPAQINAELKRLFGVDRPKTP